MTTNNTPTKSTTSTKLELSDELKEAYAKANIPLPTPEELQEAADTFMAQLAKIRGCPVSELDPNTIVTPEEYKAIQAKPNHHQRQDEETKQLIQDLEQQPKKPQKNKGARRFNLIFLAGGILLVLYIFKRLS